MRKLILILLVIFPSRIKIYLYRLIFKWDIDASAKIGFSLLLCEKVLIKKGSKIGNLTVVKGLSMLQLDEYSSLGSLNWVTGFPLIRSHHFEMDKGRIPKLHIKEHGAITVRHIIDCTDSVTIGKFTTFAGFRSQILTHSINIKQSRQRCSPIYIGDYCFIGTGSILLPGSRVPDKSILASGAVLGEVLDEIGCLYGGVPAKFIKKIDTQNYKYMNRSKGFVW